MALGARDAAGAGSVWLWGWACGVLDLVCGSVVAHSFSHAEVNGALIVAGFGVMHKARLVLEGDWRDYAAAAGKRKS